MTQLYYQDEQVTLYHANCCEVTEWLTADVLVTDPPYGIGWKRGSIDGDMPHRGIAGDADTSLRDVSLDRWGGRPAAVFGSFYAPYPVHVRHVAVWRKPPDAGLIGSTTGFRRDLEPIFLLGAWPRVPTSRSSLIATAAGSLIGQTAARYRGDRGTGHPHTKPLDVMEALICACPPGVIADPFAGSGSTLVAARNLGRKVIGVEIEERYCEVAAKRLAQDCLDLSGLTA